MLPIRMLRISKYGGVMSQLPFIWPEWRKEESVTRKPLSLAMPQFPLVPAYTQSRQLSFWHKIPMKARLGGIVVGLGLSFYFIPGLI